MVSVRKQAPRRSPPLPKFKSRKEEAEFWDTHDSTEYEDQFVEVKIRAARNLEHVLSVRLDATTLDKMVDVGRKKGVGASTLARMWLLERLAKER
jgi:hypothetical protein